jgi:hypothetical protein
MLIVLLLEETKRIHPFMIDGQDELNPTGEPNQALNGSSGRRITRLELSSRVRWSGAKIVLPRIPHGMSESSGRAQV